MIRIRPVNPKESKILTEIALAAKRHWGYPERWIEIWTPQLTSSPQFFDSNESWAAVDGDAPIAFYTLLDANEIASIENLWVLPAYMGHGIGKQ